MLDNMASRHRDQIKLFISSPRFSKGDLVKVKYFPRIKEDSVGIIIHIHDEYEYLTPDLKFHYTYDVLIDDEVHTIYETLIIPVE